MQQQPSSWKMAYQPRIAYYVTSHGYGHLNRAAAVIDSIPPELPVVVKTHPNLFEAWRQSARRPCALVEGVFDCGAVHARGESSLVDPVRTLAAYDHVHSVARSRLRKEIAFLRAGRFAAVVSDIAPLPLIAARGAGIPGILVANFTWSDIFAPFVRRSTADYRMLLRDMRHEYAQASLLLRAQPAIAFGDFAPMLDVGLVTRRGHDRRRELIGKLGVSNRSRLVYLYTGRYGQDDMEWKNLSGLADFEFVTYHRLNLGLPNWHVVDPGDWPPRDLAASVNVMVAKAGYGTVTDAMTHGTPLIFPPRFGFVEHRVLAAGLARWGGGIPIGTREFKEFRLRRALEAACQGKPGSAPWPTDGARRCAREILKLAAKSDGTVPPDALQEGGSQV